MLLASLIGGYVFLLLWVLLDDLYEVLPPAYASGAQAALIVGAAYFCVGLLRSASAVALGSGDERLPVLIGAFIVLLHVGLACALVSGMGLMGAAWATLIALIVCSAVPAVRSLRSHGASLLEWRVIVVLVLVCLLGLLLPWIPLSGNTVTDVVLRSAAATILFWSLARVLGLLRGLEGIAPYLRR